jgi:GDP-L-fucose synthase
LDREAKIYVAGHTGLVGSALVRKLETEGYSNLITRTHSELDLTQQPQVEGFFEKERPGYVFLAAAKVGGILANSSYPADFIYTNLMIQTAVLHAAYLYGVTKLLFLGSACIYPRECPQPMKEESLLTGPLEPTNEPYAVAKIAGVEMCQSYNRQYGTNFISVMPINLYGPNDNFDLENSHVIHALIRKFHEAKLRMAKGVHAEGARPEANGPASSKASLNEGAFGASDEYSVTIWGSGSPRREFLYVDDLADACFFLMRGFSASDLQSGEPPATTVNVGWGRDISIKELGMLIKEIVGFEGDITFDATKPDGTPRKMLDVSKLTRLGWKPKVSLREGIKQTYEWCLENSVL